MLRVSEEANNRRRLGLGLVAGHRRPEALARSDDPQPDVRDGGDSAGRRSHRHRRGSSQNHEGDFS